MEKVKKHFDKDEALFYLNDDEHYYGDYGKQFLSNSNIDSLINDPASFLEPREDSVNLMYGRAFHELVMFGSTRYDKVVDASTRRTNKYKDAEEENGGLLFLKKEWDELNSLVEKINKNINFHSILKAPSVKFEVPNVGVLVDDDNEVLWKCKADVVTDDAIFDIKTTSSLKGFKYSSKAYNYDSQAYIYSSLFQKPMKFLVVEKVTGCFGVFETSDIAYDDGREKVVKAQDNYVDYFLNKTKDISNYTVYGEI